MTDLFTFFKIVLAAWITWEIVSRPFNYKLHDSVQTITVALLSVGLLYLPWPLVDGLAASAAVAILRAAVISLKR